MVLIADLGCHQERSKRSPPTWMFSTHGQDGEFLQQSFPSFDENLWGVGEER
jgi:hypothetical protein